MNSLVENTLISKGYNTVPVDEDTISLQEDGVEQGIMMQMDNPKKFLVYACGKEAYKRLMCLAINMSGEYGIGFKFKLAEQADALEKKSRLGSLIDLALGKSEQTGPDFAMATA